MPVNVLIIGAGIGGLALAQGLRRAGVPAIVYERDRGPADRPQGYRLHLNPTGVQALRECLAPDVFEVFQAACGRPARTMTFYTETLRRLLTVEVSVTGHRSVGRDTFRGALLTGLEGSIRFGKTCTGYRRDPDGTVTALFADGTTATGDVLVAADGTGSVIRRQYLPHAERLDTGMRTIAGRLPLTTRVRALLPGSLSTGPVTITAPGGMGMFLALQEFQRSAADDFVSWGLGARATTTGELSGLSGERLRALVAELTAGWHTDLRALVHQTDTAAVTATAIRSSVPVPAWTPGPVTLLGDAIHAMTPARGIGANTALRDAALLARLLAAVARGERPLLEAVGEYEALMTEYGFAAVRASLAELKRQTALDGRAALALTRAALRLMDAVPPLKRRVFADLGE
ncbi:FAD-dependent oxidoreductase [Sphaerisporangium fuscum]|uniref:FAD-dependent oxidoreductase n=1 Tax=Sphaerisporangium fuscum TaxID=2835868 RepID=UPI001BDC8AB8|nr:NAD(P)/FAD-dependent oxidoreductase [Sphaerisporangium fuscum]